jgi:hypothetical protein
MAKQNVTNNKLAWRLNELATAYSLSIAFLRKEIRAGRLRAKKAGAAVLVLDEDFKRYLEQGGEENEVI